MSSFKAPSSGFITIGDSRIYYEESGSGPALLLIHAGIADSRMWDPQIEALSREHHVIRCDLRGFGQTVTAPGPFTDWEDLAHLCDALGIDAAVVIGASMGARVAVELALERPNLVSALVLVAPGLFPDAPPSEALAAGWHAIEQALEQDDEKRALDLETAMWVDGPRRDPDDVDQQVRERVRAMNARAWELEESAEGRARVSPPAVERLSEIDVPVLVLVGTEDQSDILAIADRLTDEIANARKVVVDDAAHMLSMERPALFNNVVLEFLTEINH
jgi:3-oxoadipate enol-lactonase